MKYQITKTDGPGRVWDDPSCSVTKEQMESLYSCGYKLYIDGVKQSKADALASIPKQKKETNK